MSSFSCYLISASISSVYKYPVQLICSESAFKASSIHGGTRIGSGIAINLGDVGQEVDNTAGVTILVSRKFK